MARFGTVNYLQQINNDTFTDKAINFFAADGTTPLDLTDATPKVVIRKGGYNGRIVETCTVSNGLTWTSQVLGQLVFGGFDLDWGSTGDFYYDLQLTYATSGITRTYIRGKIQILEDSTE